MIELDHRAMEELLKGAEVRKALHELVDPIGAEVKARVGERDSTTVYVEDYESDRAVVQVVIDSPYGVGLEAKHGYMARAAAEAGLKVSGP